MADRKIKTEEDIWAIEAKAGLLVSAKEIKTPTEPALEV